MNTLPILLSATFAFLATISAGIFIRKFKSNIGIICAFAAGFFVALPIFDLLPDILTLATSVQTSWLEPVLASIEGALVLFILDRLLSKVLVKDHEMAKNVIRPRIGLFSTIEFCAHGFIEGLAIGVGFQINLGLGFVVAVAVISHDFCDGISTLALMLNSGNSQKASLRMLFVDAVAPVLGAAATLFFSFQNALLLFLMSFLAGSFLYIGAGNLLPDANRMNRKRVTIALFSAGFLIVLLLSRLEI